MSTIMSTMPPSTPPIPPKVHRITVHEYDRIVRAGALDDPERVELIDGYMVDKMAKSAEHGFSTGRVLKSVEDLLPPGWISRKEEPLRIPEFDEPEPDVAIVRGADVDYEQRLPGPDDAGLVIEVSLTTLDRDRNEKLPAYARGGIPVYWIINLIDRRIEVYAGPGPGSYASRVDYGPGQFVPVMIDGRPLGEIAVDSLLPSIRADPKAEGNGD